MVPSIALTSKMAASERSLENLPDILKDFSSRVKNPSLFLTVQQDVAKKFRTNTKRLYDAIKESEGNGEHEALPELIVDNFDDEQIWQELELQNDPLVTQLVSNVSKVSVRKNFTFGVKPKKAKREVLERHISDSDEKDEKEEIKSDQVDSDDNLDDLDTDLPMGTKEKGLFDSDDDDIESDEERELEKLLDKATKENVDSDQDSESEEMEVDVKEDSSEKIKFQKGKKMDNVTRNAPKRRTVVDDKFFRMADMEAFLDREDAKEERKQQRKPRRNDEGLSSEEDEEEIDYFADIPSSSDEENDESTEKSGKFLKYTDFFDPIEGSEYPSNLDEEDRSEDSEDEQDESENEGSEDSESSEGEDIEEIFGGAKKDAQKSSFEKRQEKLKEKISELESAALEAKPWQLAGEASAVSRPENSLLQEDLNFEQTMKAAPVITEETTMKLEDIIKQRIKDKTWDDVERKIKPTEEAREYKKRAVLDQEKSKLSLGEVYEQEYLQQMQKEEVEREDPSHEEIKKMMTSLFVKLDALSNFHFTPRPAAPEVKIVNNLPSIAMEEVTPVSVSDAALLAPEEIEDKAKGELVGDSERTSTDKKRARRDKKLRQREKQKQREKKEKLIEKMNPGLGNKFAKEKAMRDLEKQSKLGKSGVTVLKDDKRKKKTNLTSSTKFFQQLQDEVTTHVKSKNAESKRKKSEKIKSSAKLKL